MKLDLKDLKLKGVDGTEIKITEAHKTLANVIYYGVKDLELADKAMKLFKDGVIELDENEVKTVRTLINGEQTTLVPFFIRELNKMLDDSNKSK